MDGGVLSLENRTPERVIDYRQCEKEPITTPGAIQSYGGLLMVSRGEVTAHSKNIHLFLPVNSDHLLHKKISDVTPELDKMLKTVSTQLAPGRSCFQALGQWTVGFRKVEEETFCVEFFPAPTHLVDVAGLEEEIDLLCRRFHYPVKDRSQFLAEVCRIFQKFVRLDQVFVQVFREGEVMEIVAEANNGKIEPVLGLHFSSKEIPGQARELYLKQLVRFKQASNSVPVDIVSDESVNLAHSLLREPSKFMTVYMQNISASSLLSFSVVIEKKLSALLTLHNRAPLLLDPSSLDRIVAVVDKVSLELLRIDDLIKKNADSKLWGLLMQDFPLDRLDAVKQLIVSRRLRESMAYVGVAVTQDGKAVGKNGECPTDEVLKAIAKKAHQMSRQMKGKANISSKLAEDFGLPAPLLGDFAGVMTIQFEDICILFFRKSFHLELRWRNAAPESFEQDASLPRFSPAGSFRFLIEEVRNQSRPWSEKDIAFGNVLAKWVSDDFEF